MLRDVISLLVIIGLTFLFKPAADRLVDAVTPEPPPYVRVTDEAARSRAVNRCKSQIEGELYHPESVIWYDPETWTVLQRGDEITVYAMYQARSDMGGIGFAESTCNLE